MLLRPIRDICHMMQGEVFAHDLLRDDGHLDERERAYSTVRVSMAFVARHNFGEQDAWRSQESWTFRRAQARSFYCRGVCDLGRGAEDGRAKRERCPND